MNKIADSIRKIAGYAPGDAMVAEVLSVQEFTCTVLLKLINVEKPDVRLNADQDVNKGMVVRPAVGSIVLIEAISETDYYVSMFSEIESFSIKIGSISVEMTDSEIKLNGAQANSYLTDINKLTAELNKIQSDIRSLKQALGTFVPTGTPADAASWTAAFSTYYSATLLDTQVADIKDSKVQH